MQHDANKSDGANNNIDADLDVTKLGRAKKNVDMKYNANRVNNTFDADKGSIIYQIQIKPTIQKKKQKYRNFIYFDYC